MPSKHPKILITAALPYANASIHIGHLIEYIQADMYNRFLKLSKKNSIYICASDTHGTPIEVNASKQGISPEVMVKKFNEEHKKDFAGFHIEFDDFYTTHSEENKELSEFFFTTLKKKGFIYKKFVEVVHCPQCDRVLPDRYVRGTCPNCGAADQYGDVCESCAMTLKGTDLIDPRCSICSTPPQHKDSEHYFFKLSAFSGKLQSWLKNNKNLQPEITNHINDWLEKGLEDWCISRDGPYFGFLIPGETNKYFYVWLDAPIGYISTTKHFTARWSDYWKKKENIIYHIIGKDIIYFHFLFWPAMLMAAGFQLPKDIIVHGFLTVNGKKMSKSRGTFFTAREFLSLYNPEYLRFYYALHLSKKLADVDLDFKDFQATINNKLVGNIANLCYRVLSFIEKNYNGKVDKIAKEKKIEKQIHNKTTKIKKSFAALDFREAVSEILAISDIGNIYFQDTAPWKNKDKAHAQVGFAANIVRNLSILLIPILPRFSESIQRQLGQHSLGIDDIFFSKKITVKNSAILFHKIENIPSRITFPLALKVAKVLFVEDHPNAENLYLLKLDLGTEVRQVVAGLKKWLSKDALLGNHVILLTNIEPATIRGVQSRGMILAADDGKVVEPLLAQKSSPGTEVSMEGYQNAAESISFENFKKLHITIINRKVAWEGTHLKTDREDIKVNIVQDGAEVR